MVAAYVLPGRRVASARKRTLAYGRRENLGANGSAPLAREAIVLVTRGRVIRSC
jgi:hypothetical protein